MTLWLGLFLILVQAGVRSPSRWTLSCVPTAPQVPVLGSCGPSGVCCCHKLLTVGLGTRPLQDALFLSALPDDKLVPAEEKWGSEGWREDRTREDRA